MLHFGCYLVLFGSYPCWWLMACLCVTGSQCLTLQTTMLGPRQSIMIWNYVCPPAKAFVWLLSMIFKQLPLQGQVILAALAMTVEKAALPTGKNKLQQFALQCLMLWCTVLPLISSVAEKWRNMNIHDTLGGWSLWCFVKTTTFSIFCGDDVLDQNYHPLGPFAKTIRVTDFVFEMVSSRDDGLGQKDPKGHPFLSFPNSRWSQNQRLADCPLRIWTYQIYDPN